MTTLRRDLKNSLLKEYSNFFEDIRINIAAGTEKEKAIKNAVDDCISRGGILSDYLLRHKSEVEGMLLTEYNEQETMAMFRRDYEAEIADAKARAAAAEAKAADAGAEAADAKAEAAEAKAELAAAKAMIAELQKNKA